MRKKIIEQKIKKTTKTYMKECLDYEMLVIKDGEDLAITIKKFGKMSSNFCIVNKQGEKITYVDEGHYIVEITPLKENYNIRFYLDKEKKIIDFYTDITLYNGIEDNIPYYVDLYLDILHYKNENEFIFDDEDELKEALDQKIISKKDFNLAYKVGNKLLKEFRNNTNKYVNMDKVALINKYF
ncbi:MAG: DUF402 domain-containing protein [Bacilli bacterium]